MRGGQRRKRENLRTKAERARVGIAPGGWQSRMGRRRQDRETERKTWGNTHASIRTGYGVV